MHQLSSEHIRYFAFANAFFDVLYFVALALDYAKHGFISKHQIAVVKHACAQVQFVYYAKRLSRSALKFYDSSVITFAAEY